MPVLLKQTPGSSLHPKYAQLNLTDIRYKTVAGVSVPATILLPNFIASKPGKYPIAVRFHGGGFGTGHRLFADWYAQWTLDLLTKYNAIGITVDYRLLPEAKGKDILEDLKDFWSWLFTVENLAKHLPAGVEGDLEDVLVEGESAGGWMAIQSALLSQNQGGIKAVVAAYPMIDLRDKHYSQAYHKQIFSIPQYDPKTLEDYVSNLKEGTIVTSRQMPDPQAEERTLILFQQGLYPKYFGTEKELYPLEVLDDDEPLPPIWIFHGEDDSTVPIEGSKKFGEKLRQKGMEVHFTAKEGEEHGFDLRSLVDGKEADLEKTEWMKEGMRFVERVWP